MPQYKISPKKVQPSGPYDSDILFVGEAPGYEEDESGTPFAGDAGDTFNTLLGFAGLSREDVRVTNICNHRPLNNKFDLLVGSDELKQGISEVQQYIADRRPSWVITLGAKPLEYLLRKKGKHNGVEAWRGSVIQDGETKYFASLHPAAALHQGTQYPIIAYDFRRLGRYITDGYEFPRHNFTIDPQGLELEECIREIEQCKRVAVDIEGVKGTFHIRCIGFGLSSNRAICIFNNSYDGCDSIFWSVVERILSNPSIEKTFQNGFGYDAIVLQRNGFTLESYTFDTMIAAHVCEPEMPYSLSFLTSIHTDEPYYKIMVKGDEDDDDKGTDEATPKEILGDYNCRDCICTFQIDEKQRVEIESEGLTETYEYKHSLIPTSLELSTHGMEVDEERRGILKQYVTDKWKYYQELLNAIVGFNYNVKSGPQHKKVLLSTFGLPERKDPKTHNLTFNEDAIVSYLNFIQSKIDEYKTAEKKEEWELKLVVCKCILLIRGYRQHLSNFIKCRVSGHTGTIMSIYNLCAATETGRGSSHKYLDNTGLNAQTWPREKFEISDEDYQILLKKVRESNGIIDEESTDTDEEELKECA